MCLFNIYKWLNSDGCIDHFILIIDILIQDANYNLENIAVVLDMILVVY